MEDHIHGTGNLYRKGCPDCQAASRERRGPQRNARLQRDYGITHAQYVEMEIAQDGRCAICHKRPAGHLHIDHDHATGKVRGLLCGNCNTALGLLQDEPHLLDRAAEYLRSDH